MFTRRASLETWVFNCRWYNFLFSPPYWFVPPENVCIVFVIKNGQGLGYMTSWEYRAFIWILLDTGGPPLYTTRAAERNRLARTCRRLFPLLFLQHCFLWPYSADTIQTVRLYSLSCRKIVLSFCLYFNGTRNEIAPF